MSKVVLDASALLALLNQEVEGEKVAAVLPDACMSAVNVSEVVAKLTDKGLSESEITEIFKALSLSVIPFDEEQGDDCRGVEIANEGFGVIFGRSRLFEFGGSTAGSSCNS